VLTAMRNVQTILRTLAQAARLPRLATGIVCLAAVCNCIRGMADETRAPTDNAQTPSVSVPASETQEPTPAAASVQVVEPSTSEPAPETQPVPASAEEKPPAEPATPVPAPTSTEEEPPAESAPVPEEPAQVPVADEPQIEADPPPTDAAAPAAAESETPARQPVPASVEEQTPAEPEPVPKPVPADAPPTVEEPSLEPATEVPVPSDVIPPELLTVVELPEVFDRSQSVSALVGTWADLAPEVEPFEAPPGVFRPFPMTFALPESKEDIEAAVESQVVVRSHAGAAIGVPWDRWHDPSLYAPGDPYWSKVALVLDSFRERGLLAVIRDEPGYASGTAGIRTLDGHGEFQAQGLTCTGSVADATHPVSLLLPEGEVLKMVAVPVEAGKPRWDHRVAVPTDGVIEHTIDWAPPEGQWLFYVFMVEPFNMGTLTHARRGEGLARDGFAKLGIMQEEFDSPRSPYAYVNLMDPDAAARFIDVAYQGHYDHLAAHFGNVIFAFATGEPMVPHRRPLSRSMPAGLAWSPQFAEMFRRRYGYDIIDRLEELFFEMGPQSAEVRCAYFDLVSALFAGSFVSQASDWCSEHEVMLTGNLPGEERLLEHARYVGDYLRSMRLFGMPGMDNLGAGYVGRTQELAGSASGATCGLVAPKLASSAAHLSGRLRTFAASCGLAGEERFTSLSDYVAIANWESVLGINTFAYLNFDWLDQTPEQARQYSSFVGRLAYMTTGGRHVADVAVLYPIASVWAASNPFDEEGNPTTDRVEAVFHDVSKALLRSRIDFDYIDEASLAGAVVEAGYFAAGDGRYRVLVLPGCTTIRLQTANKLIQLQQAGVKVIAAGDSPVRGWEQSDTPAVSGIAKAVFTGRDGDAADGVFAENVLDAVTAVREFTGLDVELAPASPFIYCQHRVRAGVDVYLLANNSPDDYTGSVRFRARGAPELWNPWTGKVYSLPTVTRVQPVKEDRDSTTVVLSIPGHCSAFVVFGASSGAPAAGPETWQLGPPSVSPDAKVREQYWRTLEQAFGQVPTETGAGLPVSWRAVREDDHVIPDRQVTEEGESLHVRLAPRGMPMSGTVGWASKEIHLDPDTWYEFEFELKTTNVSGLCVMPDHRRRDGRQVGEPGGVGVKAPRHLPIWLDNVTPGDWAPFKFLFTTPDGADATMLTLFVMKKTFDTLPAEVSVRRIRLRPVREKAPDNTMPLGLPERAQTTPE